jgi:hypothetical protein
MDYKKIYNSIIENRIQNVYDGYTENHHILPRSLGGSDDKTNLVRLNAREHFICHLLLTKIYDYNTPSGKKMVKAFMMMMCSSKNQERYITSKEFKVLREKSAKIQSESQSGVGNSQYGKRWRWIHNDITRELKKLNLESDLPLGCQYGNIFDLDKIELLKEQLKQEKILKKIETQKYLNEYYEIYKLVGFEEFVNITGYDKSKPNLVQSFNRYVDTFVPQNGKKRK